jgi:integral membrane protein
VTGTLLRYRIMAYVVGTLLIVLVCIGVPLEYLSADGSSAQDAGTSITMYVGIAHGWLYMVFLVCVALLARTARWSIGFTAVTLLSGLVPFVTFYAERRATARTRQFMRSEAATLSR